MRRYMNAVVAAIGVVVLASALPAWAFGRGGGSGGTSGTSGDESESMAGGLPALEDRVEADEALIATLQCQSAAQQAASMWTVVNGSATAISVGSSGSPVRSSASAGTVTVEHVATGQYEVTFGTTNVSGCAYEATLGDPAAATPVQGEISVSGDTDTDSTSDVFVQTSDSTGALADASFHLLVTCNPATCP